MEVAAAASGAMATPAVMQEQAPTFASAATDKQKSSSSKNLPSLQNVQNLQNLHSKFLAPYFSHIGSERGLSDNTQEAYRRDLSFFCKWFAARGPVDSEQKLKILRRDVIAYLS